MSFLSYFLSYLFAWSMYFWFSFTLLLKGCKAHWSKVILNCNPVKTYYYFMPVHWVYQPIKLYAPFKFTFVIYKLNKNNFLFCCINLKIDKQWRYFCLEGLMPNMKRALNSVAMVTSSGKCDFIHEHLFGGRGICPLRLTKDFSVWQGSGQYILLWIQVKQHW